MWENANLRQATEHDATALSELAARLFQQTFGAHNTADDMRDYLASAFTPARQRTELADSRRVVFLVELSDGSLGAYASLARGKMHDDIDAKQPAEIERIYVDQSLHGKRVGELLMNACVRQAVEWGSDVLWLAVWERNPRAIAFYEKSGFRKVGLQTFQLGSDAQHDFVMARFLSS